MNKMTAVLAALALTLTGSAFARPESERVRAWKTHDSMGCMMMRECVEGTHLVRSTAELSALIPTSNYEVVREETDAILAELAKMKVNAYLADDKYFPKGHAGVYYTVGNDFFMNRTWADDPVSMLRTLRHEAWHAAQDAMAGTIENNQIAIIYPEESVPDNIRMAASLLYGPFNKALPWEAEGKWAGAEPWMTVKMLRIINETGNKPWTRVEPTPLTRKWLVENGYIK